MLLHQSGDIRKLLYDQVLKQKAACAWWALEMPQMSVNERFSMKKTLLENKVPEGSGSVQESKGRSGSAQ